jgi:hypothetical protein
MVLYLQDMRLHAKVFRNWNNNITTTLSLLPKKSSSYGL